VTRAAVIVLAACGSTRAPAPAPAPVAAATEPPRICRGSVAQIAVSWEDRVCARCDDGAVSCWNAMAPDEPPTRFVETGALDLAVGIRDACAVLRPRGVWCWSVEDPDSGPRPIRGAEDAEQVSLHSAHACARRGDGTIACWGWNATGALGDGTTEDRDDARLVPDFRDVRQVVTGGNFSCALNPDGRVQCWGHNVNHQLDADTVDNAVALAASHATACAIIAGGTVRCWGGLGHILGDVSADDPAPLVPGATGVTAIAVTEHFLFARTTDGTLIRWGGIGLEAQDLRSLPASETGPHIVGTIGDAPFAAGTFHICTGGRSPRCWSTFAPTM
jgi:hypothetical protein